MTSSSTRAAHVLLAIVLAAALGSTARATATSSPSPTSTKPPSTRYLVVDIMPTNIIPNPDLRSIVVRKGIARITYQGPDGARAVVRVHTGATRFAQTFAPGTRVVDVAGTGARAKLVYTSPGDSALHTLPLTMNLQRAITKSRVASDQR